MAFCGDFGDIIDAAGFVHELVHRPRTPFAASAACRGHDAALWFPRIGQTPTAAKAICATCPVVADCRSFALADPDLRGVWGATTAQERRQLRRHAA